MNTKTQQASVPELTERAMLVSLSIRTWTARKLDRQATDSVIRSYSCAETAGRFNKLLVSLGSVQVYQRVAGAARTFHYANTLPWVHDGADIISTEHYFTYAEKMRELKGQFDVAVEDFLTHYPELVIQAKRDLGGLFNPGDYPPPDIVKAKFGFSAKFSPLPIASDFRVALGEDEIEKIRKQLDEDIRSGLDSAMSELWQRLHKAVKHFAEKLHDTKGIFRNTLISNLAELCEIMPRLNVAQRPEVDAMVQDIRASLCGYQPDDLRDDELVRKQAAQAAADILKKMDGYV